MAHCMNGSMFCTERTNLITFSRELASSITPSKLTQLGFIVVGILYLSLVLILSSMS